MLSGLILFAIIIFAIAVVYFNPSIVPTVTSAIQNTAASLFNMFQQWTGKGVTVTANVPAPEKY